MFWRGSAFLLIAAGWLALLTGCQSSRLGGEGEVIGLLRVGMPVAELVAQFGEPDRIEPASPEVEGDALWVFVFESKDTRMLPTRMEEQVVANPVTGNLEMRMESVLEPVELTKRQTLEVLVNGGRVDSWSSRVEVEEEFSTD